jgi:DNA-binding transcriptional LysR family regulator
MLDPRRLLTFREVAAHGSFSRAAEALALSQPAVSQQVGALERELGTKLLVRGRGGVIPTPAGELLLDHADALAARLELADTQMAALADEQRRTLRLGAFPSAIATVVPQAVAAVTAERPELQVEMQEATQAELPHEVQAGRLHVAVCFQDAAAPRREPDGLRRIDLAEEPMVAMISARHRLAGAQEVSLRELKHEPWSAPSRDGIVVNACRAAGFEPRLVLLARDPLASRAFAAAGLAVTITPALMIRLGLPGIATPALTGKAPTRSLYALVPETGEHPVAAPLVAALADALAGRGSPGLFDRHHALAQQPAGKPSQGQNPP